jgi:FxsC-like protein
MSANTPPRWKETGVPGAEPATDDGPYFFLSYAHAIRGNDPDAEDQDIWVSKLFRDLSDHIGVIEGLPPSKVGFMDRELRSGNEWPWHLSQNLATCKVLVPLYSRRFFQSPHCGKEWTAFRKRVQNGSGHGAGHLDAIIPALWSPVRTEDFPRAAQPIHFEPREFGQLYADYGFFAIMKLTRFEDDYQWAVLQLARGIVAEARRARIPPGPTMDYDSLPSAWDEGAPREMAGDKRLRIIIAAPNRGDLPVGRSAFHYGPTARDWIPYAPDTQQSIADYAVVLAKHYGYRPEVSDLYEQAEDLLSADGPASGPAVLLIDPWEATQARCQRILTRLDELDKPWIQLVVVWNRKDTEMTAAETELREAIEAALPVTLKDRLRPTTLAAARGVPSIEEIPMVLGDSMRHAARQYLKYAQGRQQAIPPRPRERDDG